MENDPDEGKDRKNRHPNKRRVFFKYLKDESSDELWISRYWKKHEMTPEEMKNFCDAIEKQELELKGIDHSEELIHKQLVDEVSKSLGEVYYLP